MVNISKVDSLVMIMPRTYQHEFVAPIIMVDDNYKPIATIKEDDVVVF
jgi:hypothetical protein